MRKKTIAAVLLTAAAVLIIGIGGMFWYLNRGLSDMMELEIDPASAADLPSGVYRGSFRGYRWSNEVAVHVSDGTIETITVTREHPFYRREVTDTLRDCIIARQAVPVDAVSEATVSSRAYMKAVENALRSP